MIEALAHALSDAGEALGTRLAGDLATFAVLAVATGADREAFVRELEAAARGAWERAEHLLSTPQG